MTYETGIVCFTDLIDSVRVANGAKMASASSYRKRWMDATQGLADWNDGEIIKNTGDGHLVYFTDPLKAFTFAINFRQYFTENPCIAIDKCKFRISLYQGVIEKEWGEKKKDIFGDAVYSSARTLGYSDAEQIIINKELLDSLANIHTLSKAHNKLLGSYKLKGKSKREKIYQFQHLEFLNNYPKVGLSWVIREVLTRIGADITGAENHLDTPATIIWPVAPRNKVTAIHRAQIEVIRLLALLGWKIKLLVANCGAIGANNPNAKAFVKKVFSHAKYRNLLKIEPVLMSELFNPSFSEYSQVQNFFHKITSKVTLAELEKFKQKEDKYPKETLEMMRDDPSIDYLRPVLTLAATHYLASKEREGKCVVIAGKDEMRQWEKAQSIEENLKMCCVLIPNWLPENGHLGLHGPDTPYWNGMDMLKKDMRESSNLAEWTFALHGVLPRFPQKKIKVGNKTFTPNKWSDKKSIRALDKGHIADFVWPILRPA